MIRDLNLADAPVVALLDEQLFGERAWSPQAWLEAAAPDSDRRFLVLTSPAEGVVGYGGVLRAGSDADILTVGVAPSAQGRGLGRELLEALLAVTRQWRCLAVFLEVAEGNPAARSLYRAAGFEEIGARRHYYGAEQHAVVMRKQLREPMGSLPLHQEDR